MSRQVFNALLLLLTPLLGACAAGAAGNAAGPGLARAAGEPLSVLIEPRQSGWMVTTNDRVQVAIFEILPNIGAGMAFPPGADRVRWLDPGRHALLTRSGIIRRHRSAYLERVSGPLGGPPLAAVTATSRPVVLAVACVCELDLSVVGRPDGPEELLGPFASLSEPAAVPRILESILPPGDVEWAIDRWFVGS